MTEHRINIGLTPEQKRYFRMEAARRDISMSELGRELLSEWLEEHVEELPAE